MNNLARHEGLALLSAPDALLKGVLEAEIEVALIAGPARGGFARLFELERRTKAPRDGDGSIHAILRQHGMRLAAAPDASRAITLASQEARAGSAAFALVPNDELDESINSISQIGHFTGAMCVVFEDEQGNAPVSCPRRAVQRLNLPCIEPCDLQQLREAMEHSLRLSKSARSPAAIVVHESIVRSSDTLLMEPNRVLGSVEAIMARPRRQRTLRWTEAGGPLRIARRLELNRFRATPNPGERVSMGFITVGPVDRSLLHITHTLGLHGRVPVLQLGLIHPIDESAISRMLTRCQHVIVLEPRAGSVEHEVLAAAEVIRRKGDQPATVWGQELPPNVDAVTDRMTKPHESLLWANRSIGNIHPSILVRQIAHLLHSIRPTAHVSSQLMPEPATYEIGAVEHTPNREFRVGTSAAMAELRRTLVDVDQWLREDAPLQERGLPATFLAIDGASAAGLVGRIVHVETWEHRRFQHDGLAALTQIARVNKPAILLVCEMASEMIRDLERLARGAVPAEAADRVTLETSNFADRNALRDLIREAALVDRLTVIIVRDGPPPQFDASAIESSFAEIDRLGFEPRQRLVRAADEICSLRMPPVDADEMKPAMDERQSTTLENEFTVEPIGRTGTAKFAIRVRPMWEELEVVRNRPPLRSWVGATANQNSKMPMPSPIHAKQAHWRVHLAGFRCESPGLAASVLCEAGRSMGYHVRCLHDPTPLLNGLRAWSQVLFTHPAQGVEVIPLSTAIPYGEADVLLGLDESETLRAIVRDPLLRVASNHRTYVVANVQAIDGESEDIKRVGAAIAANSCDGVGMVADVSAACRRWFHTDRVTDVALLGAAFQLGLIPVSPEAIELALAQTEAAGYGRAREVFDFGKALAIDHQLFQSEENEAEEDVSRLSRRMALSLSRGAWGAGQRAKNFANLLAESIHAMPGLAESESGREARRDFVLACHRCRIWGGLAMAQQFANIISRLYKVDRADTGRALTRHAILPLADVMLIRDLLYIAGTATSSEQRRSMRQRMNVKLARGDRIERRFLTRFELVAFGRRYRADVRTSDWPARTASLLRRTVPGLWRGTRRERELRDYVLDFIRRATQGAITDYERWMEPMQRLHHHAIEDRLRGMALAEAKMLLEPMALSG